MSEGANFDDLLNTPAEEVKEPVPVPAGNYTLVVKKTEPVKSARKQTDGVRFTCEITAAGEDVDADEVASSGAIGKTVTEDFWVTEKSTFMLKNFLAETLGIPESGKTLREMIAESEGCEFGATFKHEISQTSGRPYATIDKTYAA